MCSRIHSTSATKKNLPQILIYALPDGETERYMEQLISSRCRSNEDVQAVKAAASGDGFHSFRVALYDGSAPDFTKAVAI